MRSRDRRAVEGARLGAGVQRAVGRADGEREDLPPGRRDVDPAGAAVVAAPHAVRAQAGVDAVAPAGSTARHWAPLPTSDKPTVQAPSSSSRRAMASPVAAYRRFIVASAARLSRPPITSCTSGGASTGSSDQVSASSSSRSAASAASSSFACTWATSVSASTSSPISTTKRIPTARSISSPLRSRPAPTRAAAWPDLLGIHRCEPARPAGAHLVRDRRLGQQRLVLDHAGSPPCASTNRRKRSSAAPLSSTSRARASPASASSATPARAAM